MSEIALITAGLSLISSLGLLVWRLVAGNEIQRVAEKVAEQRDQLGRAVEAIGKITTELPEARVIHVEGVCRKIKEQYDQVVTEVEQHRAGVHRSIQRFDQIMRRDERAAKIIEQANQDDDEGLDVGDEETRLTEADALTQEGDRSFLAPEQATPRGAPSNGELPWAERRRAMQKQYYENHGGMRRVPTSPGHQVK